MTRGWSAAYSFSHQVLVACQRCAQVAHVARVHDDRPEPPWRMTCVNCGLVKEKVTRHRIFDSGKVGHVADPVFRLPLWLQASCRGGKLLWAYNLEHLDVLEAFIAAKLRHKDCPDWGHHHQRMIHKLPAWLKSAKHRHSGLILGLTPLTGKIGRRCDLSRQVTIRQRQSSLSKINPRPPELL